MRTIFVSLCLLVGCGSKTNPDVCCTDTADCAAKGVPDGSVCSGGLVCRGNTCIAETCTTSAQCEAGAPFCGASMLCTATCAMDSECPGFGGDSGNKFCESGNCTECRDSNDCADPARAICDAHSCRGCVADTDCDSGACGANGVCVDASSLLYLDPVGFDGGMCTQAAPCKTLTFALTKATPTRAVISMSQGQYVEAVNLDATTTSATSLEVHGHGAGLVPPTGQDSPSFRIGMGFSKVSIRDLTIGQQQNNLPIASLLELTNVKIQGGVSVNAFAGLMGSNIEITGGDGAEVRGQFTVDHFTLRGTQMFTALQIDSGASVSATNLVVTGALYRCITLASMTSGSISFATVADCGMQESTDAAAIDCIGSNVVLQSSIVWSPGNATLPPVNGCNFAHMIIGPMAVAGSSNADPAFVDLAGHDLRLTAASSAIDMIEAGPTTDIDGTLRPQGLRFDLGAYEYKP